MNPAVARKKEERERERERKRQTEGDRISSYIRTELNREIPSGLQETRALNASYYQLFTYYR